MKCFSRRLIALSVVALLTACDGFFTGEETTSTYTYDGKTYEVVRYHNDDAHTVTMYEMVKGERKFAGFHEVNPDGKKVTGEPGLDRDIATVTTKGVLVGTPATRKVNIFGDDDREKTPSSDDDDQNDLGGGGGGGSS